MPDVFSFLAWTLAMVVGAIAFAFGASILGVTGAVVVVVLILVGLAIAGSSTVGRAARIRRRSSVAPGFEPTPELFLDPATGRVTRVYVNRASGERRYVLEP